jgi:hypothetical protein
MIFHMYSQFCERKFRTAQNKTPERLLKLEFNEVIANKILPPLS